eukprot:6271494-Prymnesium_polylepis.1
MHSRQAAVAQRLEQRLHAFRAKAVDAQVEHLEQRQRIGAQQHAQRGQMLRGEALAVPEQVLSVAKKREARVHPRAQALGGTVPAPQVGERCPADGSELAAAGAELESDGRPQRVAQQLEYYALPVVHEREQTR